MELRFLRLNISFCTKSGILIKLCHGLQGTVIHSSLFLLFIRLIDTYAHTCTRAVNSVSQIWVLEWKANFIFLVIPLHIYKMHQILAGKFPCFYTCQRELWKEMSESWCLWSTFSGKVPLGPLQIPLWRTKVYKYKAMLSSFEC